MGLLDKAKKHTSSGEPGPQETSASDKKSFFSRTPDNSEKNNAGDTSSAPEANKESETTQANEVHETSTTSTQQTDSNEKQSTTIDETSSSNLAKTEEPKQPDKQSSSDALVSELNSASTAVDSSSSSSSQVPEQNNEPASDSNAVDSTSTGGFNNDGDKSDRESLKQELQNQLVNLPKGQEFRTVYDDIYDIVAKDPKGAKLTTIASSVNSPMTFIKHAVQLMHEQGFMMIKYPLNVFSSPVVTLTNKVIKDPQTFSVAENSTLLENYSVSADNVVADINVWRSKSESTPIYQVIPHKLHNGSEILVQSLAEKIGERVAVTPSDLSNPKRVLLLKDTFYKEATSIVKEFVPNLSDADISFLSGILVHRTYGLGNLEIIMADNWLEEIAINGASEPLSIYHKHYGWVKTTIYMSEDDEIYNFAAQISRKVGKQINALNPIMDAHLQTGDRVAATLFPVSSEGDTMTIRRFSRNPWTIAHMIDEKIHTMSPEVLSLLWEAVQFEMNYLVVGGTASGKTSALSTLSSLIPPTNRIISIEDTREISLPQALHWNWVPLASKTANTEGQGEVTMLDLMVASLRMRPDRIIVGEIRRKQQAEAMFEAMHTGHSVCATMHADTAEQIKRRLTQPPIDIPENEVQALHLVLVQYRDRRKGVRRSLELAEVLPGATGEKINLNYLYRWRPRSDEFVKDNDSIRLVEDLNLHTGMTQNELDDDLDKKREILEWIGSSGIRDVDKIGNVMSIYYRQPDIVLDMARENRNLEKL